MKLEVLNIIFKSKDKIINNLKEALFEGSELNQNNKEIFFDSIETFKKLICQDKLQILIAISQLSPDSIYKLKKHVNRKYLHVFNDCRELESLGFIKLIKIKSSGEKKQFQPKLIFDYDLIKVNAEILEVFPISELSKKIILREAKK